MSLVLCVLGLTGCCMIEESSYTSVSSLHSSVSNNNTNSQLMSQSEITTQIQIWSDSLSLPPKDWAEIDSSTTVVKDVSSVKDNIMIMGKNNLPLVNNDVDMVDLMSTMNIMGVMAEIYNGSHFGASGFYKTPLEIHNNRNIPVSFLRVTKDGCYYTVNKIDEGGYAYFFFERNRDEETLEYITDDLTEVYLTGAVYMEKSLYKKDFEEIRPGDSIDKVIAIDNAAIVAYKLNEWNHSITGKYIDESVSNHLLKDGLLSISYGCKGGKLFVSDIYFSDEFIYLPQYLGYNYPKYFGILPQDYPPET